MQVAFEIVITPLRCGKFAARLGDRIILKSSRQPLLDGARVLLAQGADPEARIGMRHAGVNHIALSATIGAAAKLTVVERDRGNRPVFEPWKPRPCSAVAPPIAQNALSLSEQPPAKNNAPSEAHAGAAP